MRRWVNYFGPKIAADLRKRRPKPHTIWHLDEVYLKIDGRLVYLWRAVDAEGEVLDVLVQTRRNKQAALKVMRKLLKKYGQLDGAIAMGFGWALYEKMVYDANGAMVNSALRDYRIPAFADVPRSEIYFADTYDKVGPLGAKAQGECGINPVAPAIANAVANATGVRFPDLPLTPDRIFAKLGDQS